MILIKMIISVLLLLLLVILVIFIFVFCYLLFVICYLLFVICYLFFFFEGGLGFGLVAFWDLRFVGCGPFSGFGLLVLGFRRCS